MSRFLTPALQALKPYVPGEQPRDMQYIKLNTNECPYPPAPGVAEAVARQAQRLNLYPPLDMREVNGLMARSLGVAENQVYLGNGSDEILAFCFQALCPRGVAFPDVSYGFYPVYAALYELDAQVVPLREGFVLDVEDYVDCGRTVVIANPNAPSGLALDMAQLERLVAGNPDDLVIVDEAYVHFGGESALPLLTRYDNLLVVGTFSKSRAMAGARVGYAAGSPELIDDLNRIKFSFNPYNLNRMTLAAAEAALRDEAYFKTCVDKVVATRAWTQERLREMGFECTDSRANFVYARHLEADGGTLCAALREKGILVRWFDGPRTREYMRVTVGTDAEMARFVEAVKEILDA